MPRYNIAPSQSAPIVMRDGAQRVCRTMQWGLVPTWAKDTAIASRLINARSETAASKPAFRDAMRRHRCLVPASGFYEWASKTGGRAKQPMVIRPVGDEPMAMAGLWSSWVRPDGEPMMTFTILTQPAIPVIEPIHHRMPVVLGRASWEAWLDPAMTDPAALSAMIEHPPEELVAYPVSKRVNHPANDDAALIEPVEPESDSLFG